MSRVSTGNLYVVVSLKNEVNLLSKQQSFRVRRYLLGNKVGVLLPPNCSILWKKNMQLSILSRVLALLLF